MKIKLVIRFFLFIHLIILVSCGLENHNTISALGCTNGAAPIEIDENFKFPGALIIYDSTQSSIFTYDGDTHKLITLINLSEFNNFNISQLSPDGQWLLISRPKLNDPKLMEIYLLSNKGHIEKKDLFIGTTDDNILRYYKWVNNQSILGYTQTNGSWKYGLLDPFVPKWQPFEFNFNITNGNSGIAVSPDLTRMLFVDDKSNLVLYDLIKNKKLWVNTEYDGINPTMQTLMLQPSIWAEDGSLLATTTSRKNNDVEEFGILILDKNGNLLNSSFLNNRPFGLNFSHSKKYISFYENHFDQKMSGDGVPVVRLLDAETDKVVDLCILDVGTEPVHNIKAGTILWSIDDAFVAYNYGNLPPKRNIKNGLVIQELDDGQIRLIPSGEHNFILLGWSPYPWIYSEIKP